MSEQYIAGLLTIPLGALAMTLIAWVFRLALKVAVMSITWVGGSPGDTKRARLAAVMYGSKRAVTISLGNYAIAAFHGQNHEVRSDAFERLLPQVNINDLIGDDE